MSPQLGCTIYTNSSRQTKGEEARLQVRTQLLAGGRTALALSFFFLKMSKDLLFLPVPSQMLS